eukprot:12082511-Alexandrium_andersonii.AAC.1
MGEVRFCELRNRHRKPMDTSLPADLGGPRTPSSGPVRDEPIPPEPQGAGQQVPATPPAAEIPGASTPR